MPKNNPYEIIFEEAVAYTTGSDMDMIEMARKGVSKKSLLNLSKLGSIPVKKLSELLPVSERTIQRYKNHEKFNSDVSEHLILIAKVLFRAEEVFENKNKMQNWLQTPLLGFGQKTPLSLLDTSFGAQLLMDELGRLEQGVYS
ncbi:MAG: antitoxin Xre/MbcA/ParS toxin-binding domain-containing protein [Balneolaceae bacterium]